MEGVTLQQQFKYILAADCDGELQFIGCVIQQLICHMIGNHLKICYNFECVALPGP